MTSISSAPSFPDATGGDMPTDPKHLHTLTIEDVARLYEDAGLPRTPRTLQRYAEGGHLDAQKILTSTGAKYLVTPHSVELHLTQLRQLDAQARLIATGRSVARHESSAFETSSRVASELQSPRPVATDPDMSSFVGHGSRPSIAPTISDIAGRPAATGSNQPRHVATPSPDAPSAMGGMAPAGDRYVNLLERENEFLRSQVETKDGQIKELTERSRETNMLVAGLQKMLSPLLGSGRGESRGEHHDTRT